MRRIGLAVVLVLNLALATLAVEAQPGKMARIGFLFVGSMISPPSPNRVAFIQGLRDLGWVEGSNLAIEMRSADGKPERLPGLVADLLRLRVDVIFAAEPSSAAAAKQATTEVPIVFSDPVAGGLVVSLARPRGNLTGGSGTDSAVAGKRLELLKQIVPRLTRVAFMTYSLSPLGPFHVSEAKKVAIALGIRLQVVEVGDANAFERALVVIGKNRPDALYVGGNPNL